MLMNRFPSVPRIASQFFSSKRVIEIDSDFSKLLSH